MTKCPGEKANRYKYVYSFEYDILNFDFITVSNCSCSSSLLIDSCEISLRNVDVFKSNILMEHLFHHSVRILRAIAKTTS